MSQSFSVSQSVIQPHDLSLGSLNSSLAGGMGSASGLPRLNDSRRPSGMSAFTLSSERDAIFDPTQTPMPTPGPGAGKSSLGAGHRRQSSVATNGNAPVAGARQSVGGVNLTLREQEKVCRASGCVSQCAVALR